MYNVFKRPMFKLGGQANQGTGIMSHVEPRSQYFNGGRIMANEGYDPFTRFAPSVVPKVGFMSTQDENSGLNLLRQARQKFDEEQRQLQLENRQLQLADRELRGYKTPEIQRGYGFLESDAQKKLRERGLSTQLSAADRARIERGLRDARATEEKIMSYGPSEDIRTENIITSTPSNKVAIKNPRYEETKTPGFNLSDEIRRESEELKNLLKNKDSKKAQGFLALSKALKKKGTISDKVDAAIDLILPRMKQEESLEKDIILSAYKAGKEKEQQQIRAGTLPEGLKILRAQAEKQAAATGRNTEEVYGELLTQNIKLDPVTAQSVQALTSTPVYGEITKLVNNIKDAKRRREDALAAKKDTKVIDRELLELNSQLDTLRGSKGFELVYPQFMNLASGGRVMKAVGGDIEEVEDNKLIASTISFGSNSPQDATVVEKPVEKLSYTQLRDRLPKEITNDIVMLLSNSEEALQDFAYIRTQSDVSKFNIKYGVNLIIPPETG